MRRRGTSIWLVLWSSWRLRASCFFGSFRFRLSYRFLASCRSRSPASRPSWRTILEIDRHAPGVSAWDIAAIFTLIWIGAGMIGGAKQVIELFDRLAMTP